MPFLLNGIDSQLLNDATILIKHSPDAVSGFPGSGERINLQFPPRVTDDTKVANWIETDLSSFEPMAIFKGSMPRRIAVELTYIVTGGQFTTQSIAEITQHFKAYFYRSLQNGQPVPIVQLGIYNHMMGEPADFRMLDVNFTFGETIIKDNAGTFPLMTKIKFNAALITNIDKKVRLPNLKDKPPIGWY